MKRSAGQTWTTCNGPRHKRWQPVSGTITEWDHALNAAWVGLSRKLVGQGSKGLVGLASEKAS
eukprot:scaffold70410_cov22-Tisochrysis_lutea.AAC.1